MSEDKMREESSEWALRDEFSKWVFNPKSEGYPLRNPHDAQIAWKACAAIKDAEIVKESQLCTEYIEQRNDAYKEIAARDLMIKELALKVQPALDLLQSYMNEVGGCDHSVGICMCEDYHILEKAKEALAKSEHHNSRALEKMLLEAEIKGLIVIAPEALERRLNETHAKLAELNKE